MGLTIDFNESLVFKDLEAKTNMEVLDYLALQLLKQEYVKPEYVSTVKERELEYPTGLPSSEPGIAIPHANNELINKTTLAVATLKEPVLFKNMENKGEDLPIQLVIMLAIKEPHGQIEMLQKVVNIIQDEPLRKQIVMAKTESELLALLKETIL